MEEKEYKKTIRNLLIAVVVFLCTPILPFIGVILCAIFLLFMTGPVIALVYAVAIDAFLVPDGAPLLLHSTSYVVLCLIPYAIARHNISI